MRQLVKIEALQDYDYLSRKAAEIVISQIRIKPSSLCVFPTGETPRGLFRELVNAHQAGAADFSHVRFVTLDEYAGIARDDRRRLSLWLRRELLRPLGVSEDRVHAFDPTSDPAAEPARIE